MEPLRVAFVHREKDPCRHGGERYPHLERTPGLPDLLSQSLQPLTAPKQ